ncbi:MAG: InlB B-repeat-containing protein, partial [Anaeroplasmataceae bacterium]|nr:InlB B-repeat-containing protein [Anaeroplasmataceae bacterium]
VLEDTLILLYVQDAPNNLWFRNIYIKENIFINKFYTTDSFTSSITNIKKSFSIDYLILLLNYKQEADVTNITIESNKMISPKFANEEVRIDNRSFAMPTNVTVRNNINGILNQSIRTRIVNTDGLSNWYDSNTAEPNFSNVAAGTEAFRMDTSAYDTISVDALGQLNEVEFELQERKLITEAERVFVDGAFYTQGEELEYGEHYIFLTAPTTVPLVVEGTKRMLQTNLITVCKISVERLYKITFENNQHGAVIEEIHSSRLPDELPLLSEEGYIFEGWFLDESLTQKAIAGEEIQENTILYAKWTQLHNVTYNTLDHGKKPENLLNVLALPESFPILSENGYIFEGWYLDAEFTTRAIENTIITEDTTLYAKWTKIPVYTVSFDSQGGTLVDSISLLKGSKLSELKEPTKAGYIFKGWYVDEAYTVLWNIVDVIEKDITLYAKWDALPRQFKVTFWYVGGGVFTEIVAIEKELITRPEDPTISGYRIDGWYIDEQCKTLFDFEKDYIEEDTILYGKWISAEEWYTITYDVQGHGGTLAMVNEAKKLPNPLPVLTADGYTFEGWYLDQEFKIEAIAGTEIKANTTLYAKWTKNIIYYTVTYYVDDIEYDTVSVLKNGKLTRPENPQKEGFTFYGWYEDESYTTQWDFDQDAVTKHISLYGMFVKNEPVTTENDFSILLYILIPTLCVLVFGGAMGIAIYKKRKNKSL